METAKLFINDQSQAVCLPKEHHFSGNEVGIKKVGEIVLLFPKNDVWENFINGPTASDDFGNNILAARNEAYKSQRELL